MREMLTVLLHSDRRERRRRRAQEAGLDDPETCENVVNTVRLMARTSVAHLEQGLVRHV